jgi:hypothetical protein
MMLCYEVLLVMMLTCHTYVCLSVKYSPVQLRIGGIFLLWKGVREGVVFRETCSYFLSVNMAIVLFSDIKHFNSLYIGPV